MSLIDGVTIAAAVFVVISATAAFLGFGPRPARLLLPALAGVLGVVVVLQTVAIPFATTAASTNGGVVPVHPSTPEVAASSAQDPPTISSPITWVPHASEKPADSQSQPEVANFLATVQNQSPLSNPAKAPACGAPTTWTFQLDQHYTDIKAKVSIQGPDSEVSITANRDPGDWAPPKNLSINHDSPPLDFAVDGADKLVLTMTPATKSNCSDRFVIWTFRW